MPLKFEDAIYQAEMVVENFRKARSLRGSGDREYGAKRVLEELRETLAACKVREEREGDFQSKDIKEMRSVADDLQKILNSGVIGSNWEYRVIKIHHPNGWRIDRRQSDRWMYSWVYQWLHCGWKTVGTMCPPYSIEAIDLDHAAVIAGILRYAKGGSLFKVWYKHLGATELALRGFYDRSGKPSTE